MDRYVVLQDGDVVVRQETRDGRPVYVLRTVPGPDQYTVSSREVAVAGAVVFAKREGVRAWLIEEGCDGVLLEDLRAVAQEPIVSAAFDRIGREYLDMPGLRLTAEQVQRLCGIERMLCKAILDSLVDAKFLCVRSNGSYGRAPDGKGSRRRIAPQPDVGFEPLVRRAS